MDLSPEIFYEGQLQCLRCGFLSSKFRFSSRQLSKNIYFSAVHVSLQQSQIIKRKKTLFIRYFSTDYLNFFDNKKLFFSKEKNIFLSKSIKLFSPFIFIFLAAVRPREREEQSSNEPRFSSFEPHWLRAQALTVSLKRPSSLC